MPTPATFAIYTLTIKLCFLKIQHTDIYLLSPCFSVRGRSHSGEIYRGNDRTNVFKHQTLSQCSECCLDILQYHYIKAVKKSIFMDSIETGQVFEYKIIKGDGQSDVHYSFIADDDSPCFWY